MKQFKINEKEFNIITEWDELTLRQYFRMLDLEEKKATFFTDEEYMLNIFEVLSNVEPGDIDELLMEDLVDIVSYIQMLKEKPTWTQLNSIKIDGVVYILRKDMNKLTTGEYISIKTIQEKYKGNDAIPYLLTILVRPGKIVIDPETKKESYIIDKYDSKNMEYRKELLLDKCKAVDLIGLASFFLIGNNLSSPNIQTSSNENKPKEVGQEENQVEEGSQVD